MDSFYDTHENMTINEHMNLQVVDEQVIRKTTYKRETTPVERYERTRNGHHPTPTLVMDEPYDFINPDHRKSVIRFILREMIKLSDTDTVLKAGKKLTEEVNAIVDEIEDELPFH